MTFPLDSLPKPLVGKEEWRKEPVNGSQTYQIKGLKPGTSYKVRVVAKDQSDETVHSTEELLITVPGEKARAPALHVPPFPPLLFAGRSVAVGSVFFGPRGPAARGAFPPASPARGVRYRDDGVAGTPCVCRGRS